MWRQAWGTGLPGPCEGHRALPCGTQSGCRVLCVQCWAFWDALGCWFCPLPSSFLPSGAFYPSSLLLSSPSGPQTIPQHALGRGSGSVFHVFSLYLYFGIDRNVSASGSPRDLTFCSPPALQPPRLPEEAHPCSYPMGGWTLLKLSGNPIFNAQGSS